jgi:hypothetical protein
VIRPTVDYKVGWQRILVRIAKSSRRPLAVATSERISGNKDEISSNGANHANVRRIPTILTKTMRKRSRVKLRDQFYATSKQGRKLNLVCK